jgi:hypothetical protein
MVRAVAHGEGCAVTTAARASMLSMRGVVFKPFAKPTPATPLGLAWRSAGVSAPLRQLVVIARRLARR